MDVETQGPDVRRIIVPIELHGSRLDTILAKLAPHHSRSRWQNIIREGLVNLNGRTVTKASQKLASCDSIEWQEPIARPIELVPEPRPLRVLYEDSHILVLDKPAGIVIHPAPGHEAGTLVHALLHHCPDLRGVGGKTRPGIVHRLDRDTSGALVVAKHEEAHRQLAEQFKSRQVKKEYLALVHGQPEPPTSTIETLIGRNPSRRARMSARVPRGRFARTHYQTLASSSIGSLLLVRIETGRTHQIRVHMAHIGHPIVGDAMYSSRTVVNRNLGADRQMLHAWKLAFSHPATLEPLEFESPVPPDFKTVMRAMQINYLL